MRMGVPKPSCSMEVSGMKISTPTEKLFSWGSFWWHLGGRFRSKLGPCLSFGGLCGLPWRFVEGKKQPPTGKLVRWGSFWVTFWDYVGPMLRRFGSMLGRCWVVWWALWASMEVSGGKNQPPTGKLVRWGWFWVTFWDYVWPMLGRFGSMLGPCWVIWWPERSFQKLLHGSLLGHYRSFHASIQIAEHMVSEPPFALEPPFKGKFFICTSFQILYYMDLQRN